MFILLCSFCFFVIWDSIQLVNPFVLLVLHSTCQPPPPLQRMPTPCPGLTYYVLFTHPKDSLDVSYLYLLRKTL